MAGNMRLSVQAQRSHPHAVAKSRGKHLMQRHSRGPLPCKSFPGVPHVSLGPLPTRHPFPSSQGDSQGEPYLVPYWWCIWYTNFGPCLWYLTAQSCSVAHSGRASGALG